MKMEKVRHRLLKQRRFRQVLIVITIVSIILGIWIVPIEREVGNIKTTSDGLWWAAITVTSVGYGDHYPVTEPGRVIGVALSIMGALMLGLLIAIIGTSMNRSQEEFYWNRLFDRLNELESELQTLRRQTGFIVKDKDTAE